MPRGLGEILAESGDLTFRRLRRASEWRRVHGGTIDRALLETGAVGALLAEALAHGGAGRPTACAPLSAANLGAGPPP